MICLNSECDLNDRNECVSPASIKIGKRGACLTYDKIRNTKRSVYAGPPETYILVDDINRKERFGQ